MMVNTIRIPPASGVGWVWVLCGAEAGISINLMLFANSIAGYPKMRLTRMLMLSGENRLRMKTISRNKLCKLVNSVSEFGFIQSPAHLQVRRVDLNSIFGGVLVYIRAM